MLRAIPDKLLGVIVFASGVLILFFVPWLDRSKVKSIRYKGPITKIALALFTVSFVMLCYLGLQPPSPLYTLLSRIGTGVYFAFFLLMPWYSAIDKTKPEPERVTG
jgi:ubiquinol-cytochrome c reductase cytochrome b subunit